MYNLHIGQIKVPYRIKWSDSRSTLNLTIDNSLELEVKAPVSATLDDIEKKLEEKAEWLLDQITQFGRQKERPRKKEFLSGEKLTYNGRRYRLKAETDDSIDKPRVKFEQGTFYLTRPELDSQQSKIDKSREAVIQWYKRKSKQKIKKRVKQFSDQMSVKPKNIRVTELDKKWGKHQENLLEFHWRLILAPTKIQDYVIVHELAHIKRQDHSSEFWNIVGSIIPDYEKRIEWLRVNGRSLTI